MRRDVFQAIADPVRRDIITLLAKESLNINAVADRFQISRPAISKQLKILEECGLIQIQQLGRARVCNASLAGLSEVADWTNYFANFWSKKLDALETHLAKKKKANNFITQKQK